MASIDYLYGDFAMNTVVSHEEGVKATVDAAAGVVAAKARAKLAAHRKTGAHRITRTSGDVDEFVNLDGPAPMSVEFGHWVKGKFEEETPKYVRGLNILRGSF